MLSIQNSKLLHFLLVPDKFKGSIDSISLCTILRKEIVSFYPDAEVSSFPLADGGDGFAQIIKYYFQTEEVQVSTVDPLGRSIHASYQLTADLTTAFIEMASASGLALLAVQERDVMHASSFGTGILIKDALSRGAKKIILGIGGSATNDGGVGMAEALGYQFFDQSKNRIHPTAALMTSIDCILKPTDNMLERVEFIVASDVKNPLLGPTGASHVYGPQKGASVEDIKTLELGLTHLDILFQQDLGKSVADHEGAGAAGGMGAGCMAFLNAKLISGVEFIAHEIGLEDVLSKADFIISGEGGVDEQSISGKVVGYIASLATKYHKKIHLICGDSSLSEEKLKSIGVEKIRALVSFSSSREDAIKNPEKYIPLALQSLFN